MIILNPILEYYSNKPGSRKGKSGTYRIYKGIN